ncbi:MAG: rhomboid family intramembrane serine protease [Oscillospiraceae bacterium]|nr:rhomboid family intramembrane serine protease [Oscillospiraceae bacterium]
MMYMAIGQGIVGLLDLFTRGGLSGLMMFNGAHILAGQVWRLITFVLVPTDSNPFYLLLSCYIYYWTGQMLEREWGTAKFSLFYLSGVVLSALLGLAVGYASIYYINLSIFLVIATLYGEMQVLFMFVIPIKMKWLAILDVVLILVDVVQFAQMGVWVFALAPLASFVNYFIFTWPFWSMKLGFVRRRADPQVINFRRAQKQAQKKARETGGYLHKCAVCGLTDQDDPNMEFRYCSKCDGYYCYCANHINSHIHIRQD